MENYFELFGIPVQLQVDTNALRPTFFALSRKFHPDFFVGRSSGEQQEALEKTALLNKAWKTFQQPDELIRYVLEIHGYWQAGEKYELSPDFLMEVMEINEAMMDRQDEDAKNLVEKLTSLQTSIQEPVKNTLREEIFTPSDEKLSLLKEYYYREKYLQRLREQLPAITKQ